MAGTPPCETGCSEEGAGCEHCLPADADADGWAALACGGPDCDDADPNRFPENVEVCDTEGHDEDCDLQTLGSLDLDGDGEVWSGCCNDDDSGSRCGPDCDDMNAAVGSFGTERCNGRDDDCDGRTDEGLMVPRYADLDSDGFGDDSDVVLACAPTGRHVVVRGGDCDDARASVSPVGAEVCNGLDDDCSGVVDDGDALGSCLGDGVRDPVCASGVCAIGACEVDRADCDGEPSNGCEADLNSIATCGTCDLACAPRPFGTVACVEHVCTERSCTGSAHRCDGRCVPRSVDACGDDCAACPSVTHGTMSCGYRGSYECVLRCDSGYGPMVGSSVPDCLWNDPTPVVIEVLGRFLVPAFLGSTLVYRVDVSHDVTEVQVRVVLRSDTGPVAITLNGEPLAAGMPSSPIALDVGETFVYVETVAESGRNALYTLRVVRAAEVSP